MEIFPLIDHSSDCDFGALSGPGFSVLDNVKPVSVFVAEGSVVSVLQKRKL